MVLKTYNQFQQENIDAFLNRMRSHSNIDYTFLNFSNLLLYFENRETYSDWYNIRVADTCVMKPSQPFHFTYYLCDHCNSHKILGAIAFTNLETPSKQGNIYLASSVFCYMYMLDLNTSEDIFKFMLEKGIDLIKNQMDEVSLSVVNLVYLSGYYKGLDNLVSELLADSNIAKSWDKHHVKEFYSEDWDIVAIQLENAALANSRVVASSN